MQWLDTGLSGFVVGSYGGEEFHLSQAEKNEIIKILNQWVEKKEIDVWPQVEPRFLKLMQDLKETYDPVGILNKGRFIGRI
mgnify:CR=1 FL=1